MIIRAALVIFCGLLFSRTLAADTSSNSNQPAAPQGTNAPPATPPAIAPIVPSMKNLPEGLALTADVMPAITTASDIPNSEIKVETLTSGTAITPIGIKNDCFIVNLSGALVLHNQFINANGSNTRFGDVQRPWTGTSLIPIANTNYDQLIVQSRITAFLNAANNNSGSGGNGKMSPGDLAAFLDNAVALGPQAGGASSSQGSISDSVMNVLLNNVPDSTNRPLIMSRWPQLNKALSFTSAQQTSFYKSLMERTDATLDDYKAVLTLANASAPPSDLNDLIKGWTDQVTTANKLVGQMEDALVAFFADETNKSILEKTPTDEDFAKPLNFGSVGDDVSTALDAQLGQENLSGIKPTLEAYKLAWARLKLLAKLRTDLAGHNLFDIDPSISTLSPDPDTTSSLTPGQQQVAEACVTNLSYYLSQKQAVQKLLDDADQLKAHGGQSEKALQEYQSAYDLDHDPAILQKIKDLKNETLGI